MAATAAMTLPGWLAALLGDGPAASDDAAPRRSDLPRPVRVECVGGLEIVTRGLPGAGWGGDGCLDTPARCRLRWKGRAVRVGACGVDAAFVLGHGVVPGVPDVLVHARDRGDAGAFHLLCQVDGQLHTRRLCTTAGDPGSVRVLGAMASPAALAPRHRPLAAARWLMLSDQGLGGQVVYDVLQRRARSVPATPEGLSVWHSVAPLGLSPDGRSLVRFGSVTCGEERVPHLLVADLEAGTWTALAIDRSRMRYATHEMLDPAWLAHHWAWQRDAQGRDRMVERRHFRPLPWRGSWGLDGCSYRLEGAPAQAGVACAAMLVRRFRAEAQPRHAMSPGLVMRVEGDLVHVLPNGFRVLPAAPSMAERTRQAALARRLGSAMDEELAAGLHDAAFAAWREAA